VAAGCSAVTGVHAENRASSGAGMNPRWRAHRHTTTSAGASSASRMIAAVTRYSMALPDAANIPNSTKSYTKCATTVRRSPKLMNSTAQKQASRKISTPRE